MMPPGGTEGRSRLKLVVPTSFSKKSELALDFALMYSRHIDADVYLFHALEERITDYRELDRVNVEYMERMKTAMLQGIDRLTRKGIAHTVNDVHRRISHGKAPIEILKIAAGVSADMIIMGKPSSKHFRELVDKAPCSLVLIREKDPEFVI